MKHTRETLVRWLSALPTAELVRMRRDYSRRLNVSKYRRRRRALKSHVAALRGSFTTRDPIDAEWRHLAKQLIHEGLYSRKTATTDIVTRLKRL